MSKLSVIIPVYKVDEDLFRGCVDSVISQKTDRFEMEVILVDDGCPENDRLFGEYARIIEDGLVMKVLHRENGGPGAARNTGLEAATGDYLAFADADDRVLSGIYDKAVGLLDENPGTDCVIYSFVSVTERGPETHIVSEGVLGSSRGRALSSVKLTGRKVFETVAADNFKCGGGYLWTKVFRTETLRENCGGQLPRFDESLYAYEDKLWCLRAFSGRCNTLLLPNVGYAYKNDSPSISNGSAAQIGRIENVYLAFDRMKELAASVSPKALRGLRAHEFKIVFTDLQRIGGTEDAGLKTVVHSRMRTLLKELDVRDLTRIRDRAAYRYMKLKYGR